MQNKYYMSEDTSTAHEKADVMLRISQAKNKQVEVWYKIETHESAFRASWFKSEDQIVTDTYEYKAWLVCDPSQDLTLRDDENEMIGIVYANGRPKSIMTPEGNFILGWRYTGMNYE